MTELQICHVGNQNGTPQFSVVRSGDMKRTLPVPLPPPASFPVQGHGDKQLLPALRWYLEDYLQAPFGAYRQSAQAVAETLEAWGTAVFNRLFVGQAQNWYQSAKGQNFQNFRIKITSDAPEIMAWPWEALHSGEDGYLALRFPLERQLSGGLGDPPPLPEGLPQDVLHILYVIPRPYGEQDVGYRTLAKSLVQSIEENHLPVTVEVLRPPTFDRLRQVLGERPGYYHIVHFDGHGGYGDRTPGEGCYGAAEGCLVFEGEDGQPEAIETTRLAQLLAEYRIPCMVLNACQSGMVDGQARDPFACVAAGLLKAGVYSVVAMGYSLYVSAAREFVPAFYRKLFQGGSVSEAVRAGRGEMFRQPDRSCVTGKLPLRDWVVPVLYRQMPEDSIIRFPRLQPNRQAEEAGPALPPEAALGDYGFIGRDRELQQLERAMQRQPQAALLIHGQAGGGKTTLAQGFLHWLRSTGGLQGQVFWFNFQKIRSAEYVVNKLVQALLGLPATALPMEQKLQALMQGLGSEPHLLVWDNLESASGIAGTEVQAQLPQEDLELLAGLLKGLRGGKTKVLLTSRKQEKEWLPVQTCFRVPLGGLEGEELWEYCNAVVRDLGLTLDRSNKTYRRILEKLCGNPLAIRAILLRLQDSTPEALLTGLDRAFEGQAGDESTRRLQAAYAVFGEGLKTQFFPILQLTGLHEYYADADFVGKMLAVAEETVPPEAVLSCFGILENAGFCTHVGNHVYRLHPALRGYLQQQMPAPEEVQRGFVDVMGTCANLLLREPFHEIMEFYHMHLANFYHAQRLAASLGMEVDRMALTQSLARYAQERRQFSEARRLYLDLLKQGEARDAARITSVAFHQLGVLAYEQRDFRSAEAWYQKALAIEEKHGNEHGTANTYHQLGVIAQEQRDFESAEGWYKKSLVIEEKLGNERGVAVTYHQLGRIAQERRDFKSAERWYQKALAIKEKRGDEHDAATTYHQLGVIAQEQRDFKSAEAWYKKSLAIWEGHGNEHYATATYHQLGVIAQMQRDFKTAEAWYQKALAIEEKHGNEHSAAMTYHQLGIFAQEQGDFKSAEAWCKKSLAIEKKQGNEHGAAITYHQLGVIAGKQQEFQTAAGHFLQAIEEFANTGDMYHLAIAALNYAQLLHAAPSSERDALRSRWDAQMPEEMTELLEQVWKEMKEDSHDNQD